MINNVVSVPEVSDVHTVKAVPEVPKVLSQAPAGGEAQSGEDNALSDGSQEKQLAYQLKLVVDVDPDSGEFVYKAINRITGQVVSQLPRKELLDMKQSASYKAGSVIKTDI